MQIMGLFSAWLGLIICLWLYIPFSRRILMGMFGKASDATANPVVFDTVSFVLLLILFATIVQVIFIQTTKSPEEKKDTSGKDFTEKANKKNSFNFLNVLGGLVTGFIVTAVWLSIFMAPVQYVVFAAGSSSLQNALRQSFLMPYFQLVLFGIYTSIKFFIPEQLPIIFSSFLEV